MCNKSYKTLGFKPHKPKPSTPTQASVQGERGTKETLGRIIIVWGEQREGFPRFFSTLIRGFSQLYLSLIGPFIQYTTLIG